MNWFQLFLAMCASLAVVVGGFASVYFPVTSRRRATRAAAFSADVRAALDVGLVDVKASVVRLEARTAETDRKLAVQFGGNGGGMRQAINEHGERLSYLAGRIDQLTGGTQ